MIGFMRASHQQ